MASSKTVYVSFQPDRTRIYVNELPPKQFPFVKNPDLSKMKKPPHEWSADLLRRTKPSWLHRLLKLAKLS